MILQPIDKQGLFPHTFKDVCKALNINQHKLKQLNKKYKLKSNGKYARNKKYGKTLFTTYSNEYIEHVKDLLKKDN